MKRFVVTLLLGLVPLSGLADSHVASCSRGTYSDTTPRDCTSPSPAEVQAAKDRKAAAAKVEADRLAKARYDAQLLSRYPNEAKVGGAQEAALVPIRKHLAAALARQAQLVEERRQIDIELEFYRPPHPIPAALRRRSDDNDALMAAQRALIARIQDDIGLQHGKFDALLRELRRLWTASS